MSQITLTDEHSVVLMLSQCKTRSQVERAHPHLTPGQIQAIAGNHGGNRVQELKFSEARLRKALDAAGETPVVTETHTPTLTVATAPPRQMVGSIYDDPAMLLARANESRNKRTAALADKITGLLEDLRGRIDQEIKDKALRERQEAEKKRLAEKARQEREQLKVDIAKAEEQLRALKAKARGTTTTRSPSSTSGPSKKAAAADGATAKEIRAWAATVGVDVPKVGAVRAEVVEAYEKAHDKAAS